MDERARSNKVYEGIGIYMMINGEDRGKKKKEKNCENVGKDINREMKEIDRIIASGF